MTNHEFRLRRLFNPDSGRCLDIAVDHGFFGERAFLTGIEDLFSAVQTLAAAEPDAIQLTVGQAPLLQRLGGRHRPALVLRTDVANVYGMPLPDYMYSLMIPEPGLRGVQLDAACVVVNLFDLPGRPEVREACLQNVLLARADCDRYGMPLMVEPLAMKESESGAYTVNGDVNTILPVVRQAVELGADIIKADPTDDPEAYRDVIQTATGVPVLVRGGGKVPDRELLTRTAAMLKAGAAGVVYGRNIIQHQNPVGMTRAIMAMLHDGAGVDQAELLIVSA
ncbi:aldolase [Actinomycetes bacterium]|nr:aldolase [Actinomycetes bacterium]